MDVDPFQSWHASKVAVDEKKDIKTAEWKFFDLSWDADSTEKIQEIEIDPDMVESWVSTRAKSPAKIPGVNLLVCRHKNIGQKDIKYSWLPFPRPYLLSILERLNLPAQYIHIRATGGAQSGAQTYHTCRDSDGKISRIAFLIRPAHTSITKFGSCWSFALSWDACSGRTTGILDGITASDMIDLKSLLRYCSDYLQHPLTLPEIFLEMISTHLNERIRIPSEHEFFQEEQRTGLSRVHSTNNKDHSAIWSWSFKDFQRSTTTANRYVTTLSYLKRRLGFAMQLTNRLLSIQDELETCEFVGDDDTKRNIIHCSTQRKERLRNRLGLLESYQHQNECMLKRAENLISVLYTVLSQIDSRNQSRMAKTNLQIARAVRDDSIPVRTIAYVTLVLLPGAFVAAIFGMNFFQFDSESHSLTVAHDFWLFWAITVPVTLFVVGIWNYWVYLEKQQDQGGVNKKGLLFASKKMSTEEMDVGLEEY